MASEETPRQAGLTINAAIRSETAAIVLDGFNPMAFGMTEPSATNGLGGGNTWPRWSPRWLRRRHGAAAERMRRHEAPEERPRKRRQRPAARGRREMAMPCRTSRRIVSLDSLPSHSGLSRARRRSGRRRPRSRRPSAASQLWPDHVICCERTLARRSSASPNTVALNSMFFSPKLTLDSITVRK